MIELFPRALWIKIFGHVSKKVVPRCKKFLPWTYRVITIFLKISKGKKIVSIIWSISDLAEIWPHRLSGLYKKWFFLHF